MHYLITKYIEGVLSSAEKTELIELIETDPKVKDDYISAQNIYALSTSLPETSDDVYAEKSLLKLKRKRRRNNFFKPFGKALKYAAVILVTASATWYVSEKKGKENAPNVLFQEFITPAGQRAMLKLHDGTTVWLNARSTLRYPNIFTGNQRTVELDGEAFFDVAHDTNNPFVVNTEHVTATAIGTRFNVFAYKESKGEFHAFLEEGLVNLNDNRTGQPVYMQPDDYVSLADGRFERKKLSNREFLLWKEGLYAFDNMTFSDMVKKLELYYDISINIQDDLLANHKFSGKFRQRDGVVSALRALQKARYFKFYVDDKSNAIIIQKITQRKNIETINLKEVRMGK